MFIVNQIRQSVVNVDHIVSVELNGKKIIAVTTTGTCFLGDYDNADRACEIYAEMLTKVWSGINTGIYYIPEE